MNILDYVAILSSIEKNNLRWWGSFLADTIVHGYIIKDIAKCGYNEVIIRGVYYNRALL